MLQGTDNEIPQQQQQEFSAADNVLLFPPTSLNNLCTDWNFAESLSQQGTGVIQEKDYNFGSFPCSCTSLQGNLPENSWNMGYQYNGNQFNPSGCCLLDQGKRQTDIIQSQLLNDLETAPFVKDFIDSYPNVSKPGNTSSDCRLFLQSQNVYNTSFPSQEPVLYPPYSSSNSNNYGFCVETDCLDKLCSPSKNTFSSCLLDQNPIDIESIRPEPISKDGSVSNTDLSNLIGLNGVDETSILRVESEDDSDIVVEDSDTESEVSIDVGPYIGDKEVQKVTVMRCFVCNLCYSEQFESNFVQVNSSFPLTFISQTPVMLKLIEIIPIDMQTSVKFENTLICRRCLNLIDMIENLEVRLVSVKKALCDFVSRSSKDITVDDLNILQENSDMCLNFEDTVPKEILPKEISKVIDPSEIIGKIPDMVSTGVNTESCENETSNKSTENKENQAKTQIETNDTNKEPCTYVDKRFQCERCGKMYKWEKELNSHLSKHAGQFNEKCPECGKGFMKKSNLELHLRKHRTHVCLKCRASFTAEGDLLEHIPVCEENKFICDQCHSLFTSEEKLKSHLEVHNKEPNMCKICSKVFKHPSYLEAHMKSHSDDKPFSCEKCGRSYKNQSHLRRHQKTHDAQHDCNICHAVFSTFVELQKHSLQHPDKVKCDLCDKVFSSKANMLEHKKIHTGTQKKKECPFCKKMIVSNFKAHLLSHSEEKAFKCKICTTEFSFKQSLMKHMKLKHRTDDY